MGASDEERGQEAWLRLNLGLWRLWWVSGSDLELEAKRGMSEFINRQEENNKPGEDDRKLKHTGTDDEGTVSAYRWHHMV